MQFVQKKIIKYNKMFCIFAALYGTIGGATYLAMKHVAENPHLLDDMQNNRQRRRVHYHAD